MSILGVIKESSYTDFLAASALTGALFGIVGSTYHYLTTEKTEQSRTALKTLAVSIVVFLGVTSLIYATGSPPPEHLVAT